MYLKSYGPPLRLIGFLMSLALCPLCAVPWIQFSPLLSSSLVSLARMKFHFSGTIFFFPVSKLSYSFLFILDFFTVLYDKCMPFFFSVNTLSINGLKPQTKLIQLTKNRGQDKVIIIIQAAILLQTLWVMQLSLQKWLCTGGLKDSKVDYLLLGYSLL